MRKVYRSTLLICTSLFLLLAMIGACGGSDSDSASTTGSTASSEPASATDTESVAALTDDQKAVMALPGYRADWGTPQYGGIFFHGAPWPVLNRGEPFRATLYNKHTSGTYDQLIRVDPWGDVGIIEGNVAKDWSISDDGLTYTFNLETGIKFHDGSILDCEDVKETYNRYVYGYEGSGTYGYASSMLQHTTDYSCTDPNTFVIKFGEVQGHTLATISSGTMQIMNTECMKQLEGVEFGINGMTLQYKIDNDLTLLCGSGPYITESFEPGVKATIKKNPNYWKPGLPLLDGVHDIQITDSTTRFASLTAGKIHQAGEGSSSLLPAQVSQVRDRFSDRVSLSWTGSPGQQGFSYNQAKAPFDDPRVRKAMDLVLDRDAWMKIQGADENLLYGNARISGIQAWGTEWAMSNEEIYQLPGYKQPKAEDIAEAQRLMKEAGYENGFEASCMTRTSQNYMDVCLFGMQQWNDHLGLDVKAKFLESAANTAAAYACDYDIYVTWSSGTSALQNPDWTLWRAFNSASNAAAVNSRPCDRGFPGTEYQQWIDDTTNTMLRTLDPAAKLALARQIELSLLQDSIPYSGIGWTMYNYGNAPQVRGNNWYNYGTYIYHVMHERIWLGDNEKWWDGFYANDPMN
jgi:peptide/nickel transport system substrate-binding protein